MSKQVSLVAKHRSGIGKEAVKKIRVGGRVPAIAYGAGIDPTPITVDARELYHALHTDAGSNAILRLDIEGDTHLAMAREIYRHPVRRDIVHLDFVTVSRDIAVTADIPVHLEGEPVGVTEGGVLSQDAYSVSVEVKPLEMPDSITVDVRALQQGDVLRAGDLELPAGVTLLTDPDSTIASIAVPAGADVAEADAEAVAEAKAEGETADEAEAADE